MGIERLIIPNPFKPLTRDELKPLAELRLKLNKKCHDRTQMQDSYKPKPCQVKYGAPRDVTRPGMRMIDNNIVKTDQKAKHYYRIADRRYREINYPPLCVASDNKSVYSDGASEISATNYRDYRRNGPRLPYQMWPQKVDDLDEIKIEPERYDTYARMENEYYRKMHKLTRHLWKVTDYIPHKKLVKKPKYRGEMNETRPQGPNRRTKHVELDLNEVQQHPDASELMRMHHLWEAMNKLKTKVVKCTKDVEKNCDAWPQEAIIPKLTAK